MPIVSRFWTTPKNHSDRGFIFDKLNDSYNKILSDQDGTHFKEELKKSVQFGEIKQEKADQYIKDFEKNQYKLKNSELFDFLDQTKSKIMEDDQIQDFLDELNQRAENGEISVQSVRGYRPPSQKIKTF
jgi:hypothetical protein